MCNSSDILAKISLNNWDDSDLQSLFQLLQNNDRNTLQQLGKYNVNIGEGKEIHIGDRIYNQWDEEAMEALVKAIQETSGIHQNTQGGDAAARDIDKRIIYKNCTFIQLLAQDTNFSNVSQESFNDLDFAGIPEESIQEAYQNSLPPDAEVWGLQGNEPKEILQNIQKFRRLPEFFKCLSQDKNIPRETREQFKKFAEKLAPKKQLEENNNKSSTDFFFHKLKKLESYLLATLIPDDDNNDQFLLNAWLITDDSVTDLSKFKSLVDQNEQQQGTLCKLTQIPTHLNKFLKKARRYLRGKKYQLTIEFFLPSSLMSIEIDRWKITDPIDDEITLGIKYPLRLRSLERLNLDYLDDYLPQWYEHWDKVKEILQDKPTPDLFEHLKEMKSFNRKLLIINLKQKIGLKVTCPLVKLKTKDLFKAILMSTTAIAIWTRSGIPNLDQVAVINNLLSHKPLYNLCESVRQIREEADAQTEQHLGFHLALLWENPYRLTPDIMVQLITPGQ